MANLNDADADAFFRQGDEGTYSGGPGDSIPAGVVNLFDDLETDALPRFTREQIERRDRYKRWVTGLVAALGVSALFAGAVRVAGAHTDEAPKMDFAAAQVQIVAPPRAAVVAEPIAAPPPVVAAPPAEAPPAAVAEPAAVAPPPVVRTKTERTDRDIARARVPKAVAGPTPPAAPKVVPVHSSPPTANFPD